VGVAEGREKVGVGDGEGASTGVGVGVGVGEAGSMVEMPAGEMEKVGLRAERPDWTMRIW